jgi:hypothetical protein
VAKSHVRGLHDLIDSTDLDMLVAPVELVGLPRGEDLWNEGGGDRMTLALEAAHVPAHAVHRAGVALQAQRIEQELRSVPLARRQLPPLSASLPARAETVRASIAAGSRGRTRTHHPQRAALA